MGDRNCMELKFNVWNDETKRNDKTSSIFYYTHWYGYSMPERLQNALERKERWDDDSYLARIIFCELVKGNETGSTGFGISPYEMENEYGLITILLEEQCILINGKKFTFDEYIALDLDYEENLPEYYGG